MIAEVIVEGKKGFASVAKNPWNVGTKTIEKFFFIKKAVRRTNTEVCKEIYVNKIIPVPDIPDTSHLPENISSACLFLPPPSGEACLKLFFCEDSMEISIPYIPTLALWLPVENGDNDEDTSYHEESLVVPTDSGVKLDEYGRFYKELRLKVFWEDVFLEYYDTKNERKPDKVENDLRDYLLSPEFKQKLLERYTDVLELDYKKYLRAKQGEQELILPFQDVFEELS